MSLIKFAGRSLLIVLLAGGSSAAVCNPVSIFACGTDEDCVGEAGEGAMCEINSYCSVPDEGCVGTARRWHDRAGADFAGDCLEDMVAGTGDGGGSGSETAAPGSTGDSADGSTSSPGTTSMGAEDTAGDDTTTSDDGMPMTDESTSSGGMQQTCDERYGMAATYMFCEEMPDSCTFTFTGMMVMSCDDVCQEYGGECISSFDNDVTPCSGLDNACDSVMFNDFGCVCTRP